MPARTWKRVAVLLLLAAAGGGAYAWWAEGGKRRFIPRNFGVVAEGAIYRSGQVHRRLIEDLLREHEIDLVIDLARDDRMQLDEQAELLAIEKLGIERVELLGLDGYGAGDPDVYRAALATLVRARDEGKTVLVHCAAGTERTGATVALYRMLYQGWTGPQAWEEYLSYRSRPPEKRRLRKFLRRRMPDLVAGLVSDGALAEAPSELPVFGPRRAP